MSSVLLVPDLPIERWPSMDRYASRLAVHLEREAGDLKFRVAGEIAGLTVEERPVAARLGADRVRRPASETRRYVSRYVLYPPRVRRQPGDLIHVLDHSYGHLLLGRRRRPAVITVHDLLPLATVRQRDRSLRGRVRRRLLLRVLEGIGRADAWIVSTDWMRGELARWLGQETRVWAVPYGVDEAFFEPAEAPRASLRERFGIPPDVFVLLHVGGVGPRKNFPALLATAAALREQGCDAWLLQIGGDVAPADRTPHVVATGPRSEADLRAAYHAADVLLFPSHYEGFGLPVLEAMASGLPVVTSGAGGLREVAGDAAIVVGDKDEAAYATAVQQVIGSAPLRQEMRQKGLARARTFRWSETARRTADVYRTVLGGWRRP